MFKVDEEFFDLELDDEFFQDAFNVTPKTSTQQSVSVGSEALFKQSNVEHSSASKVSHQKLPEVDEENESARACASGSPSNVHSNVLQNKINFPMGQLGKKQPSSSSASAKHCPPNNFSFTDTRGGLLSDNMGYQLGGTATSAFDVCVDKGNDPFPKTSLSKDVKSGSQKKLSFISYEDEDLNSVFSFDPKEESSAINNKAVEKSAKQSVSIPKTVPQQSISRKCTQQEGKEMPPSVLKYTSPLPKEKESSVTSGDHDSNLFLPYNNLELGRTVSAGNMTPVNIMSKEPNRHPFTQKTHTVHKNAFYFNNLSPGMSNNTHLNQNTPRNKCTSVTRKRKFPGPAGILPELPPGADLSTLSEPESPIVSVSPKDTAPQDFVCSQSLVDEFEKQPWQMMLKDVTCEGSSASVMDKFNISWVLQQACSKQLPRGKVPVICTILKNISLQGSEARVTFADKTGEMSGMIHGKLLEEYQDKLHPGAVLVLKQVTVFSPSARKHYLVITPSNLISLYGVLGDKTSVIACNGLELMAMAKEWIKEFTKSPQVSAGNLQLLPSNSTCLRKETPSHPHIGLQRSSNSVQQHPGAKVSPKQTSFAAGNFLLSKENQKDNMVFNNLVKDESHSSLNSGLCLSKNKIPHETILDCSTVVQAAGPVNPSTPDYTEHSPALGTAVSKTSGSEEESAGLEDEFDDLFSSLDEETLLSEKW